MEEEKQWVLEMTAKLHSYDPVQEPMAWKNRSIYRVPSNLIEPSKRHAYSPQLVSFGPYHHGRPHLIPMEDHKQRTLLHVLHRTSIPLQAIIDSVKQVEPQLRNQYDDQASLPDSAGAFLKMMVVDGYFMLEILRAAEKVPSDYTANDPIFSWHGMLYVLPYVKRDMLMLENQIPLLVLDRLVAAETRKPKSEDGYVHKLVVDFFSFTIQATKTPGSGLGLHVLDVYRKGRIEGPVRLHRSVDGKKQSVVVRSVTELYEAGVRFRKSKTSSLKDIEFRHGVLSLPCIMLDDTSESSLLNLLAFERLHVGAGIEVSAYVSFMDEIIDTDKDVALLQKKGIILNALGSDKAVAKLFNELSRDVTIDPNSKLGEVYRAIGAYSLEKTNVWRANLIHTYFRSPWAFLSLLAAIVLLGLTIAQTVYSALSYYVSLNQNNSSPPPPSLSAPPPSRF
ncbi:UPF0481 protein [Nymphaea thermarum]|nr:UPF0481 protein [Nymphaea thermarum]